MRSLNLHAVVSIFLALAAVAALAEPSALPEPRREFRGLWVTTVANIDWPSERGLPVARQQAELKHVIDLAYRLGFNAILLQVRPAGDAFYESPHEPWSEYLTGKMGQPPKPMWDPLAFAIAEAHARGMELHAWVNPFRASHPSIKTPFPATHVAREHAAWVRQVGRYRWIDPGEKAATDYVLRVLLDIVARYDIDGLHLDDYFYPYPEKGIEFPDWSTFTRYREAGGRLDHESWRRENINGFIRRLYEGVKDAKPWVKVGISPSGIWKDGVPKGIKGGGSFETLHADSRAWLQKGWLDYFAPQLYWRIEDKQQSFPVLLSWWRNQNTQGRHLWPGLFTSRVNDGTPKAWKAIEIEKQLAITRSGDRSVGAIHFSAKPLLRNAGGIADRVGALYAVRALVPASPWLDKRPPSRPVVERVDGTVRWKRGDPESVRAWVLQLRTDTGWITRIEPPGMGTYKPGATRVTDVAIRAVDRNGLLSEPSIVSLAP